MPKDDVPAGEVVIRTVLYEVGQGSSEGTAFQAVTNLLGGKYGVTVGKTGKGDSFSVNTANFNAVLSLLNSDNRFKQVNVRIRQHARSALHQRRLEVYVERFDDGLC